jgi:Ni,Fe-hydrogenase III large subunit
MFTIPYGPVRSGVFEAIEYVVETPGEDIPRVQTRVHYKHRGVDAAFAGRSVADGVLLAERVEGVAAVAHASAYCGALERLAGTEVPAAPRFIRVLHAELERVANHLDSTIRHTEAAGQAVAYSRLSLHKERVMRLRAKLCGSRFGRGVVVPGGVGGPPLIGASELRAALGPLERAIRTDLGLLMTTPSFLDRLRSTGVLGSPILAARGALGPLARGSGLGEDVRVSRPYGGYRYLDFSPAIREAGDALARQLVRNDEISASLHLAGQVVDKLESLTDAGSTQWAVPLERVSGEGFGWAEAPQGEVLYLVRLADGVPIGVKPRSASFHNLSLFTAAFPNDITTDFAFIEASFGLSIAGVAG